MNCINLSSNFLLKHRNTDSPTQSSEQASPLQPDPCPGTTLQPRPGSPSPSKAEAGAGPRAGQSKMVAATLLSHTTKSVAKVPGENEIFLSRCSQSKADSGFYL